MFLKFLFLFFCINLLKSTKTHDQNQLEKVKFPDIIDEQDMIEYVVQIQKLKRASKKNVIGEVTSSDFKRMEFVKEFFTDEDTNIILKKMDHYSIEELDPSAPQISNIVNPGMNLMLSNEAILNLIKCYLPSLIMMSTSSPLDINFQIDFLTIHDILMIPLDIDENKITIRSEPLTNSLVLNFPIVNFQMEMKADFNMISTFSGFIKAEFQIQNLEIYLQFYQEQGKNFFKPRINLNLSEINVAESVMDLNASFEGMPDLLTNTVLSLFNGSIMTNLQNYIQRTFVEEGSLMLNFAIDQKYPLFYPLFGEDIQVSTLMTRKPLVYTGGMIFSLLGDQFDQRFVNEADFVPKRAENVIMRALPRGSYNSQFLLSEDFVRKTLTGFYTLRPMPMKSQYVSWKFFILDVPNCEISINSKGIKLKNINIHFYNQKPDTSSLTVKKGQYQMVLSITLTIDSFDVPKSKMYLRVDDLQVVNYDNSLLNNFIAKPINYLLNKIAKSLADGNYEFPKANLKAGLSLSEIIPSYNEGFLELNGSIHYQKPKLFYFI